MRILVSGAPERVAELSAALEQAGAEVTEVAGTAAALVGATAHGGGADGGEADGGEAVGDEADGYVQLPVRVAAGGGSALARVEALLREGLLTRFHSAAAVLPRLSDGARVVLVGGHAAPGDGVPDDRAARLALMRVLGHAVAADTAPRRVRVRLLPGGSATARIVEAVLRAGPADDLDELGGPAAVAGRGGAAGVPSVAIPAAAEPALIERDWRTEVLGLLGAEI